MYNLYSYRKKRPIGLIITIIISSTIVAVTSYIIYKNLKEPIKFENNSIIYEESEKEINSLIDQKDIKYNKDCDFHLNLLYSCGHNKNTVSKIPINFYDKTINEIKNENPSYDIYDYTDFSIYATREVDEFCDNHFIIRLNGNKLSAYNKKTPDVTEKETVLNLREYSKEDLEILKNGIELSSKTELLEFFENFAS